jgi:hypothetical protein
MKTTLTLLSVLIGSLVLAQEPMSIPTDYTWHMSTESYFGHSYENYGLVIVAQDTINDTIYHRVQSIPSGCTVGNEGGVEAFFVRDEGGVWYRRASALMAEELIFDFNAEVGDTLLLPSTEYDQYNPYEVEIMAIDEIVLPNGETRNQWEVRFQFDYSNYITEHYIEGIGSRLSGISKMSYNTSSHELLTCFSDSNDEYIYWKYYEFVSSPGCCYFVEIEEYATNEIAVFPNPANEILYIEPPYADKWQVSIYNMQGALVKHEQPHQLVQYAIDIQELPSGVYTVLCSDANGKVYAQKLIKE